MRRQATGNEVLSILILSCSNYAKFKYSHADANGHCSWKNICTYLYTFSFIRQSTGPTHHCVDTLIARLVSRIRRSSLTFSSARSVKWETQSPDPSHVNVVPPDSKEQNKKSPGDFKDLAYPKIFSHCLLFHSLFVWMEKDANARIFFIVIGAQTVRKIISQLTFFRTVLFTNLPSGLTNDIRDGKLLPTSWISICIHTPYVTKSVASKKKRFCDQISLVGKKSWRDKRYLALPGSFFFTDRRKTYFPPDTWALFKCFSE